MERYQHHKTTTHRGLRNGLLVVLFSWKTNEKREIILTLNMPPFKFIVQDLKRNFIVACG